MAPKDQDDALREAARARGFRLVRSRRRKPGGDFGLYGLVGLESGRECLGFGPDGLTATPEEVHAYLRGGEVASWKRSLIGVVGEGEKSPAPKKGVAEPAEKQTQKPKAPDRTDRSRAAPAASARRNAGTPSEASEAKAGTLEDERRPSSSRARSGKGSQEPEASRAEPQALNFREATRRDAASIAKLLGLPASTLAERLAAAIRAEEPPILADQGTVIGICAYTVIQSLQQGPRGRVTALVVTDAERRQGIGSRLLHEVGSRLADAGVEEIELLLDIDLDAPTAFLRRTGWERRTNGYVRSIAG